VPLEESDDEVQVSAPWAEIDIIRASRSERMIEFVIL